MRGFVEGVVVGGDQRQVQGDQQQRRIGAHVHAGAAQQVQPFAQGVGGGPVVGQVDVGAGPQPRDLRGGVRGWGG